MRVFHGSNRHFDIVDLSMSKDKRDFGRGFYTTILIEQAKEWAEALYERFGGDGIFVYEFEIVTEDLKIKTYDDLTEEWLEMVRKNRTQGGIQHDFDIVIGPVANDVTNRTIALYVSGTIDLEAALKQLRYKKSTSQLSIHTSTALKKLRFIKETNYGKEIPV
jgi:type II restriction/modification system DNA methylase subunit YeeA